MIPISESINRSARDDEVHLAPSDISFARILVATDFSKTAALALKTAIAIGEIFNSEILLVHAIPPFIYVRGQEPVPRETLDAELDSVKEQMEQLVAGEERST